MKRINKIFILLILIFTIFLSNKIVHAEEEMQIFSNKNEVEAGEEIEVNIEIKNPEIQALTLEIYWDKGVLEYISGPEHSNNLENRIIYTWINENGENREIINIETFVFKAVQNGTGNITITGEFYNINGDEIKIDDSNLEIKVGKEKIKVEEVPPQNENVSENNSNLAVLRLNEEGISPDFSKDIKEYYFTTNSSITNLEITAIPENREANVIITGNNNLKMGENIIDIKVESQDKTKTSTYKIYVTKTNNLELANANLETLAIRQGTLEPEFNSNTTKYKVEIANGIDKIDILAIPQKEKATVKILGNGEMKEGNNKIEIIVLAENGTTNKKYEINVYRRNAEEQQKYEEERQYQTERLSAILEEEEQKEAQDKNQNQNENETVNNQEEKNSNKFLVIIPIVIIIILIGVYILRYKIKQKRK